jgi:phenylpropionate dioxygenase-like ring-hydroxylating dioxygenase large terminal subunit
MAGGASASAGGGRGGDRPGGARPGGTRPGSGLDLGLDRCWWAACLATELRGRPVGRVVHGLPVVLFRGPDGAVTALEDRCAHRGVPLSLGRCRGGELECRYHGWRYDHAGALRRVPGLDPPGPPEGVLRLPALRAVERDGLVWVVPSADAPLRPDPPRLVNVDRDGTTTVRHAAALPTGLRDAVENTLDVPHTGFLHRGLFRSGGSRHRLEVVVRGGPDRVEVTYTGEPRPDGLAGRLLAPRGGEVRHVDRFLAPGVTEVDYELGPHRLVVTTTFTPSTAERTLVHAAVTFTGPLPAALVRPLVRPVATRILRQDAWVLQEQRANEARFGGASRTSTPLDVLGLDVERLLAGLAAEARGGAPIAPAPPERHLTLYT